MMQFTDIQQAIADGFFGSNLALGGIVMYAVTLAVVLALTKNPFSALVLGLPITVLFSGLGILSGDMTIVMVILIVIGLAFTGTKYATIGGKR